LLAEVGVDVQVIEVRVSLAGLARDEAVALVRVPGVAPLTVVTMNLLNLSSAARI